MILELHIGAVPGAKRSDRDFVIAEASVIRCRARAPPVAAYMGREVSLPVARSHSMSAASTDARLNRPGGLQTQIGGRASRTGAPCSAPRPRRHPLRRAPTVSEPQGLRPRRGPAVVNARRVARSDSDVTHAHPRVR